MTAAHGALVRFGTSRIGLDLDHERYVEAFETHLRSVLWPPASGDPPPELEVVVADAAPPSERPAGLEVDRASTEVVWSTPAGRAVTSPAGAALTMWPDAVGADELLFWFTVLFEKVLLGKGLVRLHAAGVAVGDRVVVLAGDKGAGKSTVSLAFGRRGAVVLGDDQLAVQAHGSSVVVAGSYPGIRLTADAEAMLPEPLAVEPVVLAGVAKKEVALDVVVSAAPFEPFSPTDLWFPRVGTAIERVPLAGPAALARLVRAVAVHQRFADRQDRAALVDVLTALVATTRATQVTLSPDLADLDRLWAGLAGPA